MGKYVIIQDMRDKPSYKNVNARLVYLHVSMCCDISSYTYTTSLRRLAMELNMTLDALRYALKQLYRDGLLTPQVVPQVAPQSTPHFAPHFAPQLTILKINRNSTANSTANTTDHTTDYTTDYTTDCTTVNNNNNNKINKSSTLTDARANWAKMAEDLKNTLHLGEQDAAQIVEDFRARQRLKGKTWESEGDLLAHLIAWAEKRMPPAPRTRANTRADDVRAREDERRRTEEEVASRSAEETARLEIARLKRIKATVPLDAAALEDLEREIRRQEAVLHAAS